MCSLCYVAPHYFFQVADANHVYWTVYSAAGQESLRVMILVFPVTESMTNHLQITGLIFPTCEKLANSFICQIVSVKISEQESDHKTLVLRRIIFHLANLSNFSGIRYIIIN